MPHTLNLNLFHKAFQGESQCNHHVTQFSRRGRTPSRLRSGEPFSFNLEAARPTSGTQSGAAIHESAKNQRASRLNPALIEPMSVIKP